MNTDDFILLQEIIRLKQNANLDVPKRIESLIERLSKHPLWRYRKEGELDQFSYVEWKDEDCVGYQKTMFIPVIDL